MDIHNGSRNNNKMIIMKEGSNKQFDIVLYILLQNLKC